MAKQKTDTGRNIHLRFACILTPDVFSKHDSDPGGNPKVGVSSQKSPPRLSFRCLLPDARPSFLPRGVGAGMSSGSGDSFI